MLRTISLLLALLAPALLPAVQPTGYGPVTFSASLGTTTTTVPVLDQAAVTVQLNGITGTAGLQLQGSLDGSNWTTLYTEKAGSTAVSLTMTANGLYSAPLAGISYLRVIAHYITSGVAAVKVSLGRATISQRGTIAVTPTP